MATATTQNQSQKDGGSKYNRTYDLVDGAGLAFSALSGGVLSGIASVSLAGQSASQTLFSLPVLGGIALATLVYIGVQFGLMLYNDIGWSDLKRAKDQALEDVIGLSLGIGGALTLNSVSQVSSAVTGSPLAQVLVTIGFVIPPAIIIHRLDVGGDDGGDSNE
jgi:hypothetical protein